MLTHFLGLLIFSYLLGSVPFGLVVAKVMGAPDPRSQGSGNLGAANLYRQLGLKGGGLTLLGDALKGTLPTLHALYWLTPLGPWLDYAAALVGAAAVLGHVFPIYLRFKGGKGVATAFGVMLALCPPAAFSLILVYLAALYLTRIFSLSALTVAWLSPVAMGLFSASKAYLLLAGALSGLILFCHRENLQRLARGEEPRI
ncbi:MAG: glycerol-3-phosphate 1-O-acyltransferase PlsY [Deltaproteobacteria bacterium]|nr:glycerol-3-phosphate 1-O-acyltransferase PlsY [Deltaproteobacteria bacterium]